MSFLLLSWVLLTLWLVVVVAAVIVVVDDLFGVIPMPFKQHVFQECEAKFARLMAKYPEGFRAPEVLAKGLDLAVVYLPPGVGR